MQTISGMAIGSIMWFAFGYSLVFGTSVGNGVIGDVTEHFFFRGISAAECSSYAPEIPTLLYASFQMMFALMVPVIVTGAWAEKMTFEAFLLFVIAWPIFVYYPLAHWVWNANGWLANKVGVCDFAGGLTIHTSSGIASLIVAKFLQKRKGAGKDGSEPEGMLHSVPLFVLGASLIWAGWYSFNGGSAFGATQQTALALLNT